MQMLRFAQHDSVDFRTPEGRPYGDRRQRP